MAAKDVFLAAVVAGGVAAGVTYWLTHAGNESNNVDVPPLQGMRIEQARAILEPRGLLLNVTGEQDDVRFAAGQICDQRPLDGSHVKRGETVIVQVAKAAAIRVPDVTGQPLADARQKLEAAKLSLGHVTEQIHPTLVSGTVFAQSAAAGTEAHAGAAVDVTVSKGPEMVLVPNVVGRSLSRGKEQLIHEGFTVAPLHYRTDEDHNENVILKQTPAAGIPAAKGSAIDLVVNSFD